MNTNDVSSYKDLYIKVAREFLKTASNKLAAWEANPLERETLSELVRSAHSVKGQSLTMGYKETGQVALLLEKLLRGLTEHTSSPSPEVIKTVEEGFSALTRSVDNVEREDREADLTQITQRLEAISSSANSKP